jgi:hypothetical protein
LFGVNDVTGSSATHAQSISKRPARWEIEQARTSFMTTGTHRFSQHTEQEISADKITRLTTRVSYTIQRSNLEANIRIQQQQSYSK